MNRPGAPGRPEPPAEVGRPAPLEPPEGAGRPVSAGRPAGTAGTGFIGSSGCGLFSGDDPWNADVSGKPVDAATTSLINTLLGAVNIHPDFGAGFGMPINIVPASQPKVAVTYDQYADESDPGPFPLPGPATAVVEETSDPTSCGGDCHLLVVQQGTCQLFEGFACQYDPSGWRCGNGAPWDLTKKSLGQRPDGWTSADAAGLSIYAGLARYEEVMAGAITHALRFSLPCTADSYVSPASHAAGRCPLSGKSGPPMGTRVRLKASYDISGFSAVPQIFLKAFKKYGLILADNGGARAGCSSRARTTRLARLDQRSRSASRSPRSKRSARSPLRFAAVHADLGARERRDRRAGCCIIGGLMTPSSTLTPRRTMVAAVAIFMLGCTAGGGGTPGAGGTTGSAGTTGGARGGGSGGLGTAGSSGTSGGVAGAAGTGGGAGTAGTTGTAGSTGTAGTTGAGGGAGMAGTAGAGGRGGGAGTGTAGTGAGGRGGATGTAGAGGRGGGAGTGVAGDSGNPCSARTGLRFCDDFEARRTARS